MKTPASFPIMLSALLILCSFTAIGQDEAPGGPEDCTLHLIDRSKMPVTRFWRIDASTVEYEHEGSLYDVSLASVKRIQCPAGEYVIMDQRLLSVDSLARIKLALMADTLTGPADRYKLGRKDGAKYYSGGGAFAGGLFAAPTLIGPIIIAVVPPPLDSPRNPNRALLDDPDYRKGYKKAAHGKKAGHVVFGMITGIMMLFALAAQ